MKIYLINLPKDQKRRNFQIDQFTSLNLEFELIDAISPENLNQEAYQKHKDDWERPLRETEVACYFSHRQLWDEIIRTNKPAFIVEDDAFLSRCVPEFLDYATTLKEIDYITLEVRNRKKLVAREGYKLPFCDMNLFRLYLDRTGAAGYILYPSGAQKLLKREEKRGIGLTDAHITACHDLIGYQVEPAPIMQMDQCEIYGIPQPIEIISNIGIYDRSKILVKEDRSFRIKRMLGQIMQAKQMIKYFFKAQKREIGINKEDFIHLQQAENS